MSNKNDHDIYIIPPNFIETGTFFGGMFRARNVIEAGILAFAIGTPVFLFLPFGLTARIIALCLTALPVALVALIGISGESLSQFLITFLKYLRNRRIVGGDGEQPGEKMVTSKSADKHLKQKPPKERKPKAPKRRRSGEADFPAEFDEVRGYEIREKLRPKKNAKKERPAKASKAKKKAKKRPEKERTPKRPAHIKEEKPLCVNPVADYLPVEKIANGIIYTKDHRFVKVVEVVPINFMLRSAREQRNIIYSFVSYLKISPVTSILTIMGNWTEFWMACTNSPAANRQKNTVAVLYCRLVSNRTKGIIATAIIKAVWLYRNSAVATTAISNSLVRGSKQKPVLFSTTA